MVNRERLKAYVDVIQGLLSCPKGEEWILLRQHQELVNPELVEVMEQVAHHLTLKGDVKAGKYLHNWAGKLHHILLDNVSLHQESQDKSQAYVEFIQALLDCGDDYSESEIIEAYEDLIDPKLIKMMRHIASKLAAEGDRNSADYLHEMAADLNAVWLHKHEFEPTFKPEITTDPWLDEDEPTSNQDLTIRERNLDESAKIANREIEQSESITARPEVESKDSLIPLLSKVADSLTKLETTIVTRSQLKNPLWYMDVLEKAIALDWILTTDEVEQLIGVKPHCEHNETAYHRGSWVFTKVGKVGAQTGWKVDKNR